MISKHSKTEYQSKLIEAIFSNQPTDSQALLVYQNNYVENALNALSIGFPTVNYILGNQAFRTLMISYIKTHPKQGFDWSDYGDQLVDFLFASETVFAFPYLLEVAKVDWLFRKINKATNVEFNPQSFELLQTSDPSQLQFIAGTGCQILQAYFPLDLLIQLPNCEKSHDTSYKTLASEIKREVNAAIKSQNLKSFLLWRHEFRPSIKVLDSNERKAFELLLAGGNVEQVLQALGESAEQISNWMQEAITQQQICGVKPR